MNEPGRYRGWLYAAALYNTVWGTWAIIGPASMLHILDLHAQPLVLWQVVGMLVLVYAPGYWWAGRRPNDRPQLIVIAFLGKTLGLTGFAYALASGALPFSFGLIAFTNDALWLPAFGLYLAASSRSAGGWRALLADSAR